MVVLIRLKARPDTGCRCMSCEVERRRWLGPRGPARKNIASALVIRLRRCNPLVVWAVRVATVRTSILKAATGAFEDWAMVTFPSRSGILLKLT